MNKVKTPKFFTLVELTASMAILAVLILASFSFFSSMQNTWSVTNAKQESFENARIALDIISRDIESAYFGDGSAPFWHWKPGSVLPTDYRMYQNGHLAFIGATSVKPNDVCTTSYFEIKYHLYYSITHDDNEGWLRRSVTGDKNSDGTTNIHYNWFPAGVKNLRGSLNYFVSSSNGAAFTADNGSSGNLENGIWEDYKNLVPYVLDLSFTCDTDTDTNKVIDPDITTVATNNSLATCKDLTYSSTQKFPSVVSISITLLDKSSWDKWIILCGTNNVYHAPLYEGTSNDTARIFREGHQMTFSRMVYLGDRGQE